MSLVPIFINRILKAPYHYKKIFQEARIIRSTVSRTIFSSTINSKNVSFTLSDIGEGIREVVLKEWFVNIGDKVSQFDNICEVQSDKASVTITSRYDGIITKLHYQADDIALVGKPLVDLETDGKADENEVNEQSDVAPAHVPHKTLNIEKETTICTTSSSSNSSNNSDEATSVICIPSVRRLAKEHRIDLTKVNGTGKLGRILKEDVLKYVEKLQSGVISQKDSAFGQDDININVKPITGFTKAMVKTMTDALKIPHFVYSDEIKVTKLSELRGELKKHLELLDVKLTFLPFFIKAASNAFQQYPIINSSVDEKCENIIYRNHHNIGIAMATNQGLAVPVIKNCESLSLLEVARELNRLISNGKSGNFSPSDLNGGTFTISNIGIVGGTYTKPVILPPQVAIIAIGKTQILPRFDDAGDIIKEEIINISGSADHRVIDGVSMANFIRTLAKQIENPNLLFLNL